MSTELSAVPYIDVLIRHMKKIAMACVILELNVQPLKTCSSTLKTIAISYILIFFPNFTLFLSANHVLEITQKLLPFKKEEEEK